MGGPPVWCEARCRQRCATLLTACAFWGMASAQPKAGYHAVYQVTGGRLAIGDGRPAKEAFLQGPTGLAIDDSSGAVYVSGA